MEFTYLGKDHVLTGMKGKRVQLMSKGQLQKVLVHNPQLCMLQIVGSQGVEPSICSLHGVTAETEGCPELQALLQYYEDIFEEPRELPPSRGPFNHRIPLVQGANPFCIRPYRLPLKQKDIIENLVHEMLDKGVIQHSSSPFASPVVLVGKKDGTWRLCVDYRELNKHTVKDKFLIPIVEELIDELGGAMVFSKIDLRSSYHQIRMHKEDVPKTAFKIHHGHFEFLVTPFGLSNAPGTFQSLMNYIFRTLLRKYVLVFFDDILVYSKTISDHVQHLASVFHIMKQHQLYAKRSKCSFAMAKVEYLGHLISGKGVKTDPTKIQAIKDWPEPKNVKQLRSFLGLSGYYRRFIRNYASRPLTQLFKKGPYEWNEDTQEAFLTLKEALTNPPVLAIPDFTKTFIIETDASTHGIGVVLMQDRHPLAFISKPLGPRWQHLSVNEKELLALVFAV